jgi:hypothetical protein
MTTQPCTGQATALPRREPETGAPLSVRQAAERAARKSLPADPALLRWMRRALLQPPARDLFEPCR